jgi:very-short-patch-repair endonuclease
VSLHHLLKQASRNHGVIRPGDAESCSVPTHVLRHLALKQLVEPVGPDLYRIGGSPHIWEQRALLGVLATGSTAVASHRTAAAAWGLAKSRRSIVEVLVPKGTGARTPRARVHETRHLTGVDLDVRLGIPTTSVERTIIDMAYLGPKRRTEEVLDDAVAQGHTTCDRVGERLLTMPTRGRRGVGDLRDLLADRHEGFEGETPFERLMYGVLEESDLPEPSRQYPVDCGEDRYYLDFAYEQFMVAIECDSVLAHSTPVSLAHDLRRQNDLLEAGWTVRRFLRADVRDDLAGTVERVRKSLVERGWQPPGPHPN